MTKIDAIAAAGLLLAALASPAAETELKRFSYSEPHMGTTFKLVFYAPDESAADKAQKAAFARVAELDGIMSDYKATSELMQLCKKAGGDPVQVSDELFTVLAKSQEVARASDGAFDVTVGPIVKLWRRARRSREMPDPKELAAALELVGYDKVKLDPKEKSVQLSKAGMQLDLGGIAKGYTSDEVLAVLRKQGLTRALCAAGGDIAVGDAPPGAEGWKIGIAPLEDPDSEPKKFLLLANQAVSTSGDAEQYVEIDGKRYSHIVDPHTGIGLVGRMSVTVVARNGITSDSLTKVGAVLGPEKGFKIIEQTDGTAALLVRKTDTGEEVIPSKRFQDLKVYEK
jgi:thiamine biosynthesis lipoprotein